MAEIIDFATRTKTKLNKDIKEPKNTEKDVEYFYTMIQAVIMTHQGPQQIIRILRGTKPLDENDIKTKMEKVKSNIITANGENSQNDIIQLIKIIVEDYGYLPIEISSSFSFMPEMPQNARGPIIKG